MGVTGLWTVVQPCARPIKLETLNKKRLAVDASIWIYQFLKAVRDKEGNALRNSHVVGFFRRICKLLFFGIKPVFVFDGGAPILKRQTVSGRKARREGRREDAVRTAGKLLAVQMQRRAEEEDQRRREERDRPSREDKEEEIPENLVYVDELQMTAQERQQNRTFRKKDAYHLPNLDVDLADMGASNDPRIMSHEELEEYARQFHSGEDVNIYDFSKIDFESPFFLSLPASDRYNILNAGRLRSRLRMGYSKEQLDTMFPNRMDFSRFQIERVKERNELTQRLMNLNGMNGEDAMFGINNGGRVAGEKGKEYVLVKNDGVEGGWALGVVSNKGEGEKSKPIDVEALSKREEIPEDEEEEWEDDGFEDIPIEGLNRLPRRQGRPGIDREELPFDSEELAKRRRALYEAKIESARPKNPDKTESHETSEEIDSLFVPQVDDSADKDEDMDALFEDVPTPPVEEEDEQLQRAIAMSLGKKDNDTDPVDGMDLPSFSASAIAGPRIDQPLDFNQKNAKAGRDFAHLTNSRAFGAAPKPFGEDSDEDDFNLQASLEESRHTKRKTHNGPRVHRFKKPSEPGQAGSESLSANHGSKSEAPTSRPLSSTSGFDGPLPFESLNLGKSILGKKKKPAESPAGGFEKEASEEKPAQPLPPWFSGDIRDEVAKQKVIEERQFEGGRSNDTTQILFDRSVLRRQETGEIIDLEEPKQNSDKFITVESSDGDDEDTNMDEARPVDAEIMMDDIADLTRAEAPISDIPQSNTQPSKSATKAVDLESKTPLTATDEVANTYLPKDTPSQPSRSVHSDAEGSIDWSESETETDKQTALNGVKVASPKGVSSKMGETMSPTPEFEDVGTTDTSTQGNPLQDKDVMPSLPADESTNGAVFETLADEEDDGYSDPEDEDLMRQLAIEAEEHARFASTLNQKSQLQNAEDYEKELRQLRNQQKKDRRDADEVTRIMVTECQQLLRLFGLPYVTAPMEAEAQCAALVSMNLVDGIVTDDSDIFLFGGTRVYKNMFNQAKFVECYLASDLEKEYSLTREKLIRFAHLLGSDYTEGLPSVGPVTALEILSEFDDLGKFAAWWSSVQMAQQPSAEDNANSFRRKFRKNAAKIFLPTTFPDTRVDYAYLHPEVDNDPEPFQWGVPDLDALRSFLMATIGWSQERTDEVLVPVIKDMNRRENEGTQANITQFFGGGVGAGTRETTATNHSSNGQVFAPRRRTEGKSKRMENALGRLHERAKGKSRGDLGASPVKADSVEATANEHTSSPEKAASISRLRKSKKRAALADGRNEASDDASSDDSDDAEYQTPSKARRGANGARKARKRA